MGTGGGVQQARAWVPRGERVAGQPEPALKLSFSGRNVVVTGASKGIGRATARAFASAGAGVAICARGEPALREAEAELRSIGVTTYAAVCDVADGAALPLFIEAAARALGGIDVLVNNPSAFGGVDTEEAWARIIEVDLMGAVRACRAALPYLERSQGNIIHITSVAAFGPSARLPAYAAIKAAVNQYTQSQAMALAAKKIRVNAVAPGSTEFPGGMWAIRKAEDSELYSGTLRRIPFGRMGRPEEIANAVLFLASDAATWITGHTLVVDGGQGLAR